MKEITNAEVSINGAYKDSTGALNPIYVANADGLTVQFINNSNQRGLHHYDCILEEVADRFENGDIEGYFTDGFSGNEIFFEVLEEGEVGTLNK